MAELIILLEGYVKGENNEIASSTITLVKTRDYNIIIDPGTAKSQELMTKALKRHDLTQEDINIVALTHSHMDHFRNIGMFRNAKALDSWGLWENDTLTEVNEQFSDEIQIIRTPGHSDDGITFLIKTRQGKVAVCGDVFWKKDYPKEDPYASDLKTLEESRKKVLSMADWIVPGHSGIFKVSKPLL